MQPGAESKSKERDADPGGWHALYTAAASGQASEVRILLEGYPDRARRLVWALQAAAEAGHTEVMQDVIELGAEVNALSKATGQNALLLSSREGREEACRLLIRAGACVDACNEVGCTPLMHATIAGHEGVMNQLLGAGAAREKSDAFGNTALSMAAAYNREGPARILLDEGCSPDHQNLAGFRPRDHRPEWFVS